jgi:hypothetical protein
MMLQVKSNFIPVLSILLLLIAVSLAGCTSKEQALKEREASLEKFVTSLTQNIFDRNPQTIKESMGELMRLQLSEKARDKLQAAGEIPDTELDVLKIIDENQNNHHSNKVQVDLVRPLGPVDKNQVPFKVTGKNISLINGKPGDDKVFSITVVCELTPEMGGYPRAVEVTGLPSAKAVSPIPNKASNKSVPAVNTKRKHHR